MNISTKYEMGQLVTAITQTSVERPPVKCAACDEGKVILRGESYECPACKGKGKVQARAHGWVTTTTGRVGKIEASHMALTYDEKWGAGWVDAGEIRVFVKYMLDATGIGSGTLYEEPNLFQSKEEAQTECDRRNNWTVAS